MPSYTVMGVQGAPFRPPFGSFAGKPETNVIIKVHTVMGVQGAPFRPPWGMFAGKPVAVVSAVIPHNLHFHATVGKLKSF